MTLQWVLERRLSRIHEAPCGYRLGSGNGERKSPTPHPPKECAECASWIKGGYAEDPDEHALRDYREGWRALLVVLGIIAAAILAVALIVLVAFGVIP